jgi:hypothetical protein
MMFPCSGDAVDTIKVTGDTLLPAEDFAAMVRTRAFACSSMLCDTGCFFQVQSAVSVKEAALPSKVCVDAVLLAVNLVANYRCV